MTRKKNQDSALGVIDKATDSLDDTFFESNALETDNSKNASIIEGIRENFSNDTDCENLAKKLLLKFYNDVEIQKLISDSVFASGEYENISSSDFACSLVEIFNRLKTLKKKNQIRKLQDKYKDESLTEEEKIKVSREIIEQVKQH